MLAGYNHPTPLLPNLKTSTPLRVRNETGKESLTLSRSAGDKVLESRTKLRGGGEFDSHCSLRILLEADLLTDGCREDATRMSF